MDSLLLGWTPTFATLVTVTVVILISQYRSTITLRTRRVLASESRGEQGGKDDDEFSRDWATKNKDKDEVEVQELNTLKLLYYRLHNLERFPEVLPQAKRLLLSLLSETSTTAQARADDESILSVQSFSREALEEFQRKRDSNIGKEWEKYNVRRKSGGARELFSGREEATWWLKQIAPVKYVDGAWLGHIGKVTTPFGLRKTVKGAWQILSEELGDGDLGKNHVHLYHKLLEDIAPGFPTPEVADFGHPHHGLDELSVWKSAIAQLLVSLFPHEFLPEILGFNLHFEAISLDTLMAGKELKEVGIDPYYFILHISIDNAHCGHSAIAIEVVCEYMDFIRRDEGREAAQKAWERLQAGYLLSSGLPGTVTCPSRKYMRDRLSISLKPVEREVIRIFKAKAQVVHGIHCSSKVRIGSRSVADWLDPIALESKRWQKALLDALSCSSYWICRGDSSKSRFVQELQWNGRMFGSFTQDEYDVLRRWIDDMPNRSLTLSGPDVTQNIDDVDILSESPAFNFSLKVSLPKPSTFEVSTTTAFPFESLPPLIIGKHPVIESFLPLWLSHPCLLQSFVSVPFRTKNKLACMVVKILRAQGGFEIEQECVAGMGEIRRPNSLGLIGIGLNMMAQHDSSLSELHSLKEVLRAWPSEFAVHMMHISTRPLECKGLLIGMATAFARMHMMISRSQTPLLSTQDVVILQNIAMRELEGFEFCWKELKADGKVYADCCKGYLTAAHEIERSFSSESNPEELIERIVHTSS